MSVLLKIPAFEELSFRQQLLRDEATMQYNHAYGGTIDFAFDRWENWYARWILDRSGAHFYRYVFDEALGQYVGEAAYHLDADNGRYLCDVIIHAQYRRRGCGGQALHLLCEAARGNGVNCLHDDIAIDNPALSLFLNAGFIVVRRTASSVLVAKQL